VAALAHWDRAAESIVENLANGNSRHAAADRNRYFDVAFGSALECAACLDICVCKKLITVDQLRSIRSRTANRSLQESFRCYWG
jgi:four helix bundle protein